MSLLHNQTVYRFRHKLGGLPVALTKRWPPVPLMWDISWEQPRGWNLTHLGWNPPTHPGFPQRIVFVVITQWKKKHSNPEESWIIMTSLYFSSWEWIIKMLTVFRWHLLHPLLRNQEQRERSGSAGVFLQAQIQCDRLVGNNWCVFLMVHLVNRNAGMYFLIKKNKLVAKEWVESLTGSVRTWLSEQ